MKNPIGRIIALCIVSVLWVLPADAQRKSKKDYLVAIKTEYGTMQIVLSDKAPLHKANFLKLAQNKQYDGLLFHRVIESFMIQGGDPNSRNAEKGTSLGNGDVGYRIPAEFHPDLYHKKGALAAARDNNPEKESSGCQFYIVQGKKWSESDLKKQVERSNQSNQPGYIPRIPTEEQKNVYLNEGGSPHLDGNYTVFGQVIDGLAVIDSIATQPKDQRDRPLKDVVMSVSVEKTKKKKITKQYGYVFE